MLHFIKARFNYSICFVIYASLEFHVLNGLCVTCMLCFTEDISLVLIGMSDSFKQRKKHLSHFSATMWIKLFLLF